MADRLARAANNSGNRLSRVYVDGDERAVRCCIPAGTARKRICGASERRDRISLGGWADEQLPRLAADLVNRQVTVMFGGGPPAARAAKTATTKIPVVFTSGEDPVKIGLVTSINRPGGNVTGVSILLGEAQAKRLEILRDLIPTARSVGLAFDPDTIHEELETAAQRLSLQLYAAPIKTENDVDAAFASFANHRVDAVFVGADPDFSAGVFGLSRRRPELPCLPSTNSAGMSRTAV